MSGAQAAAGVRDAAQAPAAQALAEAVVLALVEGGVRDVTLAPGSRSAPFAYALVEAERRGWVRLRVVVDERCASFVALGAAVASGRPTAVVVTSGSAVANLHPALLEAAHQRVPLVVVSCDRPAELVRRGASQTTQQVGIFGSGGGLARPRAIVDVSVPSTAARAVAEVLASARGFMSPGERVGEASREDSCVPVRATGPDTTGVPGPVHLNVQLSDPLVPRAAPFTASALAEALVGPTEGSPAPRERENESRRSDPGGLARGSTRRGDPWLESRSTVVLAADGAAPADLAAALGAGLPVLAEPTARCAGTLGATTVLLDALADEVRGVVVLGRPTLSRGETRLLARDDVDRLLIDPPGLAWLDVPGARHALAGEVWGTVPDGGTGLTKPPAGPHETSRRGSGARGGAGRQGAGTWNGRWYRAHQAVQAALQDELLAALEGAPLEGWIVARIVAQTVARDGGLLVAGASMAVRDLDLAAAPGVQIAANRGLAGIDGTVSTAVGHALVGEHPGRTRALLGDLTLQHDIGGLVRGRDERPADLQIVVLADGGGSIFATLEHGRAEHAAVHERVFATPQLLDLAALARAVGARHVRAEGAAPLAAALASPRGGLEIVEVPLTRAGAAERRRARHARLVEVARRAASA